MPGSTRVLTCSTGRPGGAATVTRDPHPVHHATAGDPRAPGVRNPWHWLVALGGAQVVAGGLVAALTGPFDLSRGSWLAAYLVLVGGVAQYVMGNAGSWLGLGVAPWTWFQPVGWNVGNAGVVTGTLVDEPLVVDAGAVVLLGALVTALANTRGAAPTTRSGSWLLLGYRLVLLAVAAGLPVGVVLAHVRT